MIDECERHVAMFAALGDLNRYLLLQIIAEYGGHLNASQLQKKLNDWIGGDLRQPTLSHHLHVLEKAQLIEPIDTGWGKFYRLRPAVLTEMADMIRAIADRCEEVLV